MALGLIVSASWMACAGCLTVQGDTTPFGVRRFSHALRRTLLLLICSTMKVGLLGSAGRSLTLQARFRHHI